MGRPPLTPRSRWARCRSPRLPTRWPGDETAILRHPLLPLPLLLLVLCSSATRANAPTSPQEDALRHEQNEQRALDKVEAARDAEIFAAAAARRYQTNALSPLQSRATVPPPCLCCASLHLSSHPSRVVAALPLSSPVDTSPNLLQPRLTAHSAKGRPSARSTPRCCGRRGPPPTRSTRPARRAADPGRFGTGPARRPRQQNRGEGRCKAVEGSLATAEQRRKAVPQQQNRGENLGLAAPSRRSASRPGPGISSFHASRFIWRSESSDLQVSESPSFPSLRSAIGPS